MKPLIVLISASIISGFAIKFVKRTYNFQLSARVGMSMMLLFTAMGHFMFTEGMTMMVPELIPFKKELIYFTAIIEIAGAIGLHLRQYRLATGWLLILFFILIMPANIKASIDHLDYQNANYNGFGLQYLWFRIPLQILFIAWVYFSSIKIFKR